MKSPGDRLLAALEAFRRDAERERVHRWRADPDASSEAAVAARHARLRGPIARELVEEIRDRGALDDEALAETAAWLREAAIAPARASARARVDALASTRVPYDSDHFAPDRLLDRVLSEPREKHRLAMGRALTPYFGARLRAIRDGAAEIEEAAAAAEWLDELPSPIDRPGDLQEAAEKALSATSDAWAELTERIAHAGQTELHTWTDLLHALRGARWDDLVAPAQRWRRLGSHLEPLGLDTALARRVKAEPGRADGLGAEVACLEVPTDIRIAGGRELGVYSERAAAVALGRALAAALTHATKPALLRRAAPGSVGRALGELLAHLYADPVFATRALSLRGAEHRPLRELALGHELASLRMGAAKILATRESDSEHFEDAARTRLREALGVDAPSALAAGLFLSNEPHTDAPFRSARWAAPMYVWLRERFDDDWWRNPRVAELLRNASARGPALSVEAWMADLGVDPDALGPRITELLA